MRLVNENIMGVSVENREMFASQVPYGYKRVYSPEGKQHIEIDPVAGPVIRWILVDLYVGERLGLWGIADRLNGTQDLQRRGGKTWMELSLNHIVDRVERYAGYVYVNRVSPAGPRACEGEGEPCCHLDRR